MRAYKTHLTVKDPKQVVLTDLPFRAGQRVEVLILREDSSEYAVRDFELLLKETQSLPQTQAISEADIAAEIAAYRGAR
jgi:antitoxin ParD1/3/4